MTNEWEVSRAELHAAIDRDWTEINQFLDSLSEAQWTEIENPDGWTIKDHVAHLSAWEESVTAFLTGKPRYVGLGVSRELYESLDIDAVNHEVFLAHRDESLEHVQSTFASTHETLLGHINQLSEDELYQPYTSFLPDEPGDGDGPPAMKVVYENTTGHYREHIPWMKEQLGLD